MYKQMKPLLLILTFQSLSGCVTSISTQTYLPDGDKGWGVNCSYNFSSWNECYKEAGQKCGEAGYEIIEKNEKPFLKGNGILTYERNMLIKCKPRASEINMKDQNK